MTQRPPLPAHMAPMADAVPRLDTERLVLRSHARDDWEAFRQIMMSDRAKYIGGKRDEVGAWSSFASDMASWMLDGFGYWTAARRSDDKAMAFVGIIQPSHFPETEIGWLATTEGEGQGYVSEAVEAALNWAYGSRALPTLVSYIHRDNTRSIAVAERVGAKHDPDAKPAHDDDIVYRHPRRAA